MGALLGGGAMKATLTPLVGGADGAAGVALPAATGAAFSGTVASVVAWACAVRAAVAVVAMRFMVVTSR
jgi:hypothetical protein